MEKIKIRIYIYFFAFSLMGCAGNKKNISEIITNPRVQIIDISKAEKVNKILLSQLFSRVNTIILETNANILLGKINGMQIYKDWIFVLDRDHNVGVYAFDKKGAFIQKYGKRGIGPGEYLSISDFTIDTENNTIYLMDSEANQILRYNISTGEYINKIMLENKTIRCFHIQYNNEKLYTDIEYVNAFETGCMVQEIDLSTGKQKQCWLDSHQYNKGWNGPLQRENESFFYSRNKEAFKYIHFFMDTIVSFQKNQIEPAVVLKEKDWISAKEVSQIMKERTENKGVISFQSLFGKEIAFNINNYMEWNDFISFQYQKKDDSFFILHNIKTGNTQITSLLIDDLVYNKPKIVNGFSCSDSSGLYGIVNTDELTRFIEQSQEKDFLNSDLDKNEILKNLPADSNPIIFYYEF